MHDVIDVETLQVKQTWTESLPMQTQEEWAQTRRGHLLIDAWH